MLPMQLLAKGAGLLDKHIVQDKVEPACVGDGYFSQINKECSENGSDKEVRIDGFINCKHAVAVKYHAS